MKKQVPLITTLVAAVATAGILQVPAHAVEATRCDGLVTGAVTRLVVKAGDVCRLRNATVEGNIRIEPGGALLAYDSIINGSVNGTGARFVEIIDTDVIGTGTTGNINLSDTAGRIIIGNDGCAFDPRVGNNIKLTDNHGNIAICMMTVGETITLQGNDGNKRIGVFDNVVGNTLSVTGNEEQFIRLRDNEVGTTEGGAITIKNNTTTGDATQNKGLRLIDNHSNNAFSCSGNRDQPTGYGNTAESGFSGQCEKFGA